MSSIPFGYLFPTLLIGWCTYYVAAPRKWPRLLNALGSYFGVINELPFLALIFLTGSSWLAFMEGDIQSPGGWAAFGITILTVGGLVAVIYRALQTAPIVRRALDDSLGKGWHASIEPKMMARLRKKFVAAALLGPFFRRRFDVERVANISYGDAGKRNLLDVYRHRSHPAGCPALIHLHGGRYVGGKKNTQSLPLLYRLASQGWVCISANYRLSPAAKFPDHLIDVKKIIAWVREHGHEYGADPAMIFAAGNSAGAHLAAMAVLTSNNPAYQPGFENVDTSVSGAICLYGYYGFIDTKPGLPSSPMACSGKDAPAFFVAHGDRDRLVPVQSARSFVEHVRHSSSHPVVYVELPYADHNFDLFHSIRTEAIVHGIEAFAAWVRSGRKQ